MVLFMCYKRKKQKRIITKTGSCYCCPEEMVSLTMEVSGKKEEEIKKIKWEEWKKPRVDEVLK